VPVTTPIQTAAEADARAFAAEFPTPNTLRAIALCEAGILSWSEVAALFARSLAAGLEQQQAAAEYGRLAVQA
jgi:hypothetical protein